MKKKLQNVQMAPTSELSGTIIFPHVPPSCPHSQTHNSSGVSQGGSSGEYTALAFSPDHTLLSWAVPLPHPLVHSAKPRDTLASINLDDGFLTNISLAGIHRKTGKGKKCRYACPLAFFLFSFRFEVPILLVKTNNFVVCTRRFPRHMDGWVGSSGRPRHLRSVAWRSSMCPAVCSLGAAPASTSHPRSWPINRVHWWRWMNASLSQSSGLMMYRLFAIYASYRKVSVVHLCRRTHQRTHTNIRCFPRFSAQVISSQIVLPGIFLF